MNKKFILIVLLLVAMVSLTGCLPGDGRNTEESPAGFLWGVWHGWVAPISLIMGLFRDHITIYETFNVGWWYDFGFYIAIISGFGGLSLTRKKRGK